MLQGNMYKIFPFRRPVSQMGEYLYFSNSDKLNVASGFLVIYNIIYFCQSICHWDPETVGSQSQKYVQLIM